MLLPDQRCAVSAFFNDSGGLTQLRSSCQSKSTAALTFPLLASNWLSHNPDLDSSKSILLQSLELHG
jgi:hypothetical protein